jgi:hypothetical protein
MTTPADEKLAAVQSAVALLSRSYAAQDEAAQVARAAAALVRAAVVKAKSGAK